MACALLFYAIFVCKSQSYKNLAKNYLYYYYSWIIHYYIVKINNMHVYMLTDTTLNCADYIAWLTEPSNTDPFSKPQ